MSKWKEVYYKTIIPSSIAGLCIQLHYHEKSGVRAIGGIGAGVMWPVTLPYWLLRSSCRHIRKKLTNAISIESVK